MKEQPIVNNNQPAVEAGAKNTMDSSNILEAINMIDNNNAQCFRQLMQAIQSLAAEVSEIKSRVIDLQVDNNLGASSNNEPVGGHVLDLVAKQVQAIDDKMDILTDKVQADENKVEIVNAVKDVQNVLVEKLNNLDLTAGTPIVLSDATQACVESREEFEKGLGYPVSDEAYNEYLVLCERIARGEEVNTWIPDPDNKVPVPEGCIVPKYVAEDPKLNEIKDPIVEMAEEALKDIVVTEIPAELVNKEVKAKKEKAKANKKENNKKQKDIIVTLETGENINATDVYNKLQELNANLSEEELINLATEWFEFGIDEDAFDKLVNVNCIDYDTTIARLYTAFYVGTIEADDMDFYINDFGGNLQEDKHGNMVYIDEALDFNFINENNIAAFYEYILQQEEQE